MTFPVDIHNQKVNALCDTGTGCSLINYSMYEKLGMNVDKGYQPTVKSSTGEDMGVLGQVTFTFKINDTPFTQSFIVCRHMTRHMILGTDFTAKTAFVTPFGKYEFHLVPFGLAQAPAYFQLLMKKVLEGLPYAMTYLDDIIIFSKNGEDHLKHLEEVFH